MPLGIFGVIVLVIGASFGGTQTDSNVARGLLVFGITVVVAIAVVASYGLAESLTAPLRSIAKSVDRVSAGDLRTRLTATSSGAIFSPA